MIKRNEIRLAKLNGTLESDYAALVEALLRDRYSLSDELAILRQRDSKPSEFTAYNEYAEECKREARARFGMEEDA